jgi:heat shock protein HslJ
MGATGPELLEVRIEMINLRADVATLAALALTASLGVSALAADEVEPEPDVVGIFSIENVHWLLTSQLLDGQMTAVPDGVVASLFMRDGEAGGSGGCNNYFTSYEMDGFDVTFGRVGSTLMACSGPAGDVENTYFANLSEVIRYQSGGIEMALLDAGGDFVLEFALAPQASVVGPWVAQGINNGAAAVVSSETTSAVTADFADDGSLTGNDGCNDYSTTYEVDGESISIAPEIASTRMACASEALAEQSQQYYAALAAATTWSSDAQGDLELRDDDGALQVRYVPAE